MLWLLLPKLFWLRSWHKLPHDIISYLTVSVKQPHEHLHGIISSRMLPFVRPVCAYAWYISSWTMSAMLYAHLSAVVSFMTPSVNYANVYPTRCIQAAFTLYQTVHKMISHGKMDSIPKVSADITLDPSEIESP